MAELDAETLRELRRAKTAANLQSQAAQLSTPQGMQSYLERIQSQLSGMKTGIEADKAAAEASIAAAEASKAAAAQAKADAEKALMDATGTTTLAAAKKAAVNKDVSRNPAVVQAKKDLADVQQQQQQQQQYSGGYQGSSGGQKPQTYTAPDGRIFTDLNEYNNYLAKLKQDEKTRQGQSAYNLLFDQFNQYGMGALVEPLKDLITQGLSQSEFTLRLRETDAYKKRFAANAARTAKGLRALSEAEYIGLEDQYQNVMRNYGLPASYYARGDMGRQEGFEKFIGGDVSAAELEDRIQTAQNRVINAAPEITKALRSFYPDITNGDILAYTLDPEKALTDIKRRIGAAEIGGAALGAGLATDLARAEQLQKYGVTQAQAQQGYQTIGGGLKRGSELASIYQQPDYTQTTAEQEVFGLPSATEAQRKRKQLIGLETSTFGGKTGAGGALTRERAGQF